ncbi:YqjK family protein [Sideroxyarcus sp. TK5]
MNRRLLEIRLRRAELRGEIADQRAQLAAIGGRLQGGFHIADTVMSVFRFLRGQPLLSGVLAALLVRHRQRVWRVLRTSFGLWKSLGWVRSLADRWFPSAGETQRR